MPGLLAADITNDLAVIQTPIVTGQSLSDVIDLKAGRLHRINLPAGFPSVDLTFQVSDDGLTFANLYDADGEYKIPAAAVGASRSLMVDFSAFYGIRLLKLRTGTSGAPAVQAADRAISMSTFPR